MAEFYGSFFAARKKCCFPKSPMFPSSSLQTSFWGPKKPKTPCEIQVHSLSHSIFVVSNEWLILRFFFAHMLMESSLLSSPSCWGLVLWKSSLQEVGQKIGQVWHSTWRSSMSWYQGEDGIFYLLNGSHRKHPNVHGSYGYRLMKGAAGMFIPL